MPISSTMPISAMMLIGIVKKNAIMMIDFALEAEREGGQTPENAIFQACLLRFRPIMMTTMAALLGGVPLALGTGTGSELRRPLGITIIGGLIFSQMLTLYTTPVIYLAFDRLAARISGRRGANRAHTNRFAGNDAQPVGDVDAGHSNGNGNGDPDLHHVVHPVPPRLEGA